MGSAGSSSRSSYQLSQRPRLENVPKQSELYKTLLKLIAESISSTYNLQITRIQKVINTKLLQRYKAVLRCGPEHYFFHGTTPENVAKIIREGYKKSKNIRSVYNVKGTYVSPYADRALGFSTEDIANCEKLLLLTRVAPDPKRKCCTTNACRQEDIIITQNARLYPEYIIYVSSVVV